MASSKDVAKTEELIKAFERVMEHYVNPENSVDVYVKDEAKLNADTLCYAIIKAQKLLSEYREKDVKPDEPKKYLDA